MNRNSKFQEAQIPPYIGKEYEGDHLRFVAMPIGGIGAGQVSICGDGGLRQWEILNQVNHQGYIPHSFFSLRVSSVDPPTDALRVLLSRQLPGLDKPPTPLISDDYIPDDQIELLKQFTGVEKTTFLGAYPFAKINYQDSDLPIELGMQVFNPFIPLDSLLSGLPAILVTFQVRNIRDYDVHGCIGATLQNVVGWDGITPIVRNQCPLFGGNVNRIKWEKDSVLIFMDNPSLPEDHPGNGELALAALHKQAAPFKQWSRPSQFMRFLEGFNLNMGIDAREMQETPAQTFVGQDYTNARFNRNRMSYPNGPSSRGQTWSAGLIVPFWLGPQASTKIRFVMSWYFPNRYVNFDQFGLPRNYGKSRFWLGNHYAKQFAGATEVVDFIKSRWSELEKKSLDWSEGLFSSSLPEWLKESLAAQGAHIRSPSCFWTEDGKFYGFEGALGESTGNWTSKFGGSCPLNCTHVWNYEQAISRLFPTLEQSMREAELKIAQAPEGYIPHRILLPLYLPQFRGEPIGGPKNPALDGMLGAPLKVYRELRQGAGLDWFKSLWENIKRLMEYVQSHWDPAGEGILVGEQPNTFDNSFFGVNIYIGGLWLSALLATEKLARLANETDYAEDLHESFSRGSKKYDELLWNGEYYYQVLEEGASHDFQFGKGVLSTQLLGQWWAHQLELGYILPSDHIKSCLRSIVSHNLRHGFPNTPTSGRTFADGEDSGIINCTWPHGGQPEKPIRYADEVWTGIEYQVGALCIMEGLVEDGYQVLGALRGRYTGERRNPYNEIECGDHYSRALAGWSVLEAISGFRYNALENRLRFTPIRFMDHFQAPFVAGRGWGTFESSSFNNDIHSIEMRNNYGEIPVERLVIPLTRLDVAVKLNETPVDFRIEQGEGTTDLVFPKPLLLSEGSRILIELG